MTDDGDLSFMNAAEPVFGAQAGLTLVHVHGRDKCEGRGIPCCIHDPSGHHMRGWPMNWRSDTGVMERICSHGVGHPDPDHMAFVRSLTPEHECDDDLNDDYGSSCPHPHLEWQGVHGCDGCCQTPILAAGSGAGGD